MSKRHWIKLWPKVLNDRAFMRMPDSLRLLAFDLILVAGAEGCDDGTLPDIDDIDWYLRRSDLLDDMTALAARWDGLELIDGRWTLRNFDKYQEAPSTKRTREWREKRHGDGHGDGHGNAVGDVPEDRSRRQKTEAEAEVDSPARAREAKRFVEPVIEEIEAKMCESVSVVVARREAAKFVAHYGANGWRVGKNKMRSWPHAVAGWLSRMDEYDHGKSTGIQRRSDGNTLSAGRVAANADKALQLLRAGEPSDHAGDLADGALHGTGDRTRAASGVDRNATPKRLFG